MRRLYLLLLLGTGACAHRGPEPAMPIASPCISAGDVPAPVPPIGRLPDDARQAADLLAATVLALRGNERLLRALIGPCTILSAPTEEGPSGQALEGGVAGPS